MTEINRVGGVVSEAAVLVGVILDGKQLPDDPLDELAGLAETAGAHVVGRLTQRRPTPGHHHLSRQGQSRRVASILCEQTTPTSSSSITTSTQPDPQSGKSHELQGSRSNRADPRHLRQPSPDASSSTLGRTGSIAILAAAAEADVDPLVAYQGRASACAGLAKSSWKSTAGWSKNEFTICKANWR